MGIVSEPTKFERIHQLLRYTSSSSSVAMCVWFSFASLSISRITSSVRFNSSMVFSEPCVTNKSIVNVRVSSFSALLLELIRSVVFSSTFFLPVPVTVRSAIPDVKVRDREEIENGFDVLFVFCCVISQEVSARAVDDAMSQCARHALHCAFGSTSSISQSSVFPAALITFCDSLLKGLNARCC